MKEHKGLPVSGYAPTQKDETVQLVNRNKEAEERVLRILDELRMIDGIDHRWLAIGRTHIEEGFMSVNRALFQPSRFRLSEDDAAKTA